MTRLVGVIRDGLRRREYPLLRVLPASLLVASLTHPALAASPLGEYRVAAGCAPREVFEQQLERRLQSPGKMSGTLGVIVERTEGTYVGHVTLRTEAGTTMDRVVMNPVCDQVLHAMALVGALLLEPVPSDAPAGAPEPIPLFEVTAASPTRIESREVVIAPSRPQKPVRGASRRPSRWATGPFYGLTADGQFSRDLGFGQRLGWSLTNYTLVSGSQLELSASFARLNSGSLDYDQRNAAISWNSVRIEACFGSGAHTISTVGGCASFDTGQLQGTGRVSSFSRSQTSLWSRLGGALRGRQALVGALSLDAKLGAMLATSRPEFYFAASDGHSEQSVHRAPLLGLVADLALELLFW